MYGLVPNKHQGSLSSEDIPLLLPPQVYKLVLLDLPGLLFFSTYTLLVLFWAEIYHQVPHSPFVLNHLHFFFHFYYIRKGKPWVSLHFTIRNRKQMIRAQILVELQARSLPTDKLRPAYIAVNTIIYVVQVFSSLTFSSFNKDIAFFLSMQFLCVYNLLDFFSIIEDCKLPFSNFDSVPLVVHLDRFAFGYTSE